MKKDTAIDLDEKIRGYWLVRTWNLTEREISGIKIITQGQTELAQVKKAITQTIVAKKREEVRGDLREAGDRAKGGGRARSTGKSIDELKKVTPCNRCGAIGHWEADCTQPARSRKKRSPLRGAKEKVVGSGEKNLMARDEEVHRTTRLWRSTMTVRKLKRHM